MCSGRCSGCREETCALLTREQAPPETSIEFSRSFTICSKRKIGQKAHGKAYSGGLHRRRKSSFPSMDLTFESPPDYGAGSNAGAFTAAQPFVRHY